MKLRSARWLAALFGLLGLSSLHAAPPAYSDGDLLLGFRASADPSANLDVVVNLGSASKFTTADAPFTVDAGNLAGNLAIFTDVTGDAWSRRADVFWGGIATDLPGDPTNTLYVTRPRVTAGAQSVPWDRGTFSLQSSINSTFRGAISGYRLGTANANNAKAVVQGTSSQNSWASFTFGGTDFNAYSGIEGDFGGGTANSILDLYRLTPTTQNPAGAGLIYVGSFKLDDQGVLTFTPPVATEPNFRLSALTYEGYEESLAATVKVIRGGLTAGADTVQIDTADVVGAGGAVAGTDYTALTSQLVQFAAGQTQKDVPITLANRTGNQGNRAFTVTLSAPSAGVLNTPSTAAVTIHDGAPPAYGELSFSPATYNITPVDENAQPTVLTVTITRALGSDGAVSATVGGGQGGTLVAATDYTIAPATVQFGVGETSKDVTVTLTAAGVSKAPGTIALALSAPQGGVALGANSTATITVAAKDVAVPTLRVTTRNNAIITAQGLTISGSAQDNAGVARIEISVNGGAPVSVQPASNGTFSQPGIQLENGKNTIQIKSIDQSGNASKPVTLKVTYRNSRPALAGVYTGLILPAGTPSNNTTGYATVTVAALGTFTGSIRLGPAVLPIRGLIDNDNVAHFNVTGDTTAAATTVALTRRVGRVTEAYGTLSLSLANNKAAGTIEDGSQDALASFSADHRFFDGRTVATSVTSNYLANRGKYTAYLPAQATQTGLTSADYPQGNGYAFVTVAKTGNVVLTGKLADGTAISAAGPLTQDYHWALYSRIYPKLAGVLAGTVVFDDTQTDTDFTATNLLWIRPPQATAKQYATGWPTGIFVDLKGAKYAVTRGASIIPGLAPVDATNGNANVAFSNGKLNPTPQVRPVNIATNNRVTSIADSALRTALVPASGLVSGRFKHTDGSTLPYIGVVFQKGAAAGAYGFFLSNAPAGESGGVSILPLH